MAALSNPPLILTFNYQTEKDQREESEANRFIEELESAIPSLLPNSTPLTAKLLLVFWALSL